MSVRSPPPVNADFRQRGGWMEQGGFRLNSSLQTYGFKRLVLVFCAIDGEADWAVNGRPQRRSDNIADEHCEDGGWE